MFHLKSLNKYFLKYKWHFLLGIVFVTFSNICGVYGPQIIRNAIDHVTEQLEEIKSNGNNSSLINSLDKSLLIFAGIYLLVALLRGLFMFLMRQTLIVMSRNIEFDQKNELYAHYQKLTPSFYKRNNTGDLMNRISEDVGRVRQYVGPSILYILNLVVVFILVIYAMVKVNPLLTFYVLLPLPFLSLSVYFVKNLIEKRSEKIQSQLSHITSMAQETYSGIRLIKAYTQEKTSEMNFEEACEEYKIQSLKLAKIDAFFQPLMVFLIGLSTLLVVYVGGLEVIKGNITIGNVAEFIIYVNMLTWPVTSLGWVASLVQRAAVSQKRINEFLNEKPEIESDATGSFHIKGDIEFKDVSFTYPDTQIEALKNVSFAIRQGEKVAIVGKTGSGKTTIADLLVRLYDTTSGKIYIDGKEINSLPLPSVRSEISYVPQDVFLFGDSVKQNISFGLDQTSIEEVRKYARYAFVDNEIMQFQQEYETIIGERGVTLSGGQKQRISIARAFIKESPVIILDDCLSAVDSNTEFEITNYLNSFLNKKTAIIITHRLFSLLTFDKILVLENGTIAEMGTHEQLLNNKGIYFDILQTQNNSVTV